MITNHIQSLSVEGAHGGETRNGPLGLFYRELSPTVSKRCSLEPPLSLRELLRGSPHRGEALLRDSYELLRQCFPDRNVIAHRDTLQSELCDPTSTFDINVLTSDQSIIGAVNSRLLTAHNPGLGRVGAIEHLYTNPDFRGRGVGIQLVLHIEAQMVTWGAHHILCELNDPLLMSHDAHTFDHYAGITAEKRRAFWKNRGFYCVNAPYIQPRTEPDTEEVYHMMVGLKPLTNRSLRELNTNDYIQTLRAYHTAWTPFHHPSPVIEGCYRSIHQECGPSVELVGLDIPRTMIGAASRPNQRNEHSPHETSMSEVR